MHETKVRGFQFALEIDWSELIGAERKRRGIRRRVGVGCAVGMGRPNLDGVEIKRRGGRMRGLGGGCKDGKAGLGGERKRRGQPANVDK